MDQELRLTFPLFPVDLTSFSNRTDYQSIVTMTLDAIGHLPLTVGNGGSFK